MEQYKDFFSSRYFMESNNYDENLSIFDEENDSKLTKSKNNEKFELINNINELNENQNNDSKIEINNKILRQLNKNKKEIIKERNRISAKKYRERIKEKINNLEKENKKLKEEINKLKLFLNNEICKTCKEKYELINDKNYIAQSKLNNLKKKKVFGLFTVICICFLFIGYEYKNGKQLKEIINGRKLINDNQNIDVTYYKLSQIAKNYRNRSFITLGDYYSIFQNNYLGRKILKFKNNGKIRILNGYENIDIFNEMCENCVVDISDNIINDDKDPLYFRIFIFNQNLIKNRTIIDEELIQKGKHQFIEVNCKLIGISQNFVKIK